MSMVPWQIAVSDPDPDIISCLQEVSCNNDYELLAESVDATQLVNQCRTGFVDLLIVSSRLFESAELADVADCCHELNIPIIGVLPQLSRAAVAKATFHNIAALLAEPVSKAKLAVSIGMLMARNAHTASSGNLLEERLTGSNMAPASTVLGCASHN